MSSFSKYAFLAIYILSLTIEVSTKKHKPRLVTSNDSDEISNESPRLETSNDSDEISNESEDITKSKRPYIYREPRFYLSGSLRKSFAFEVFISKYTVNVVCSPVSALMPVAKLALGAEGHTQRALLDAVGVSKQSKIKKTFRKIIKQLKYLPGVKLNLASRIYMSDKSKINKSYAKEVKKIFKSTVEKVNFDNIKETEDTINAWLAKQTGTNKGQYLGYKVSGQMSAIILNVVTFQGDWDMKFYKIEAKSFHSPTGVVSVPMMTREGLYNYTSSMGINAQVIEIPYEKEEASFIVILPHSRTGLSVLLKQLKLVPELLNHAMKRMEIHAVKVSIPKFRIHSNEDVVPIFKKVGLKNLFHRNSGLTRIITNDTMFISDVRQVTVIEVNEKGTKATAATAPELKKISIIKDEAEFNANHPFLFYVKGYSEQIFAGVYAGYEP